MNQFLLSVILLAVAACATPGLEENRSEAVQTSQVIQTSEAVQSSEAVQTAEAVQSSETVQAKEPDGGMLAHNATAENFDGIKELEAPTASEIPAEMIPGRAEPEPAIVCERVVPTGSVLAIKVCRNKEEIERKREADQEMFRDIQNNTALGNSRL